jgi:replicative DNA helicase
MQGVKMVVIDHAGLVPLKGLQNGRNDAKNIGVQLSNPLKRLASELGIIIVLLVQLSREGRKDPAAFPKMHHLRDSGEYEQDAAVVLMLWNDNGLDDAIDRRATLREKSGICLDTETFDNTFNLVRIAIEKNRNGSKGAKYLMYHGDSFSYEDREKAELRVVQNKLIPEEVVGHECACS